MATSGEDEYYQYDGLYQLANRQRGNLNLAHTTINNPAVREEEFDYDPIGNWEGYVVKKDGTIDLDQERDHNKMNEVTQIDSSGSLVSFDLAGNMTKCPPDADLNWGNAYDLKWDAWNRLVQVKSGETEVASYVYDGLSRRITKEVGGQTRHFFYNDQWRTVEERVGSQSERTYDWGIRYRDDAVRRDRLVSSGSSSSGGSGSGSQSTETHYVLHDYFNVVGIVDISGAVVERYGYSAFGQVRFMDADFVDRTSGQSAYDWDLLFKAQFLDKESGYYNYGYRYLNPSLGRWLALDPIGERGGLNLFAYTLNDPVNANDLLGLKNRAEDIVSRYSNVNNDKDPNNDMTVAEKVANILADIFEDHAQKCVKLYGEGHWAVCCCIFNGATKDVGDTFVGGGPLTPTKNSDTTYNSLSEDGAISGFKEGFLHNASGFQRHLGAVFEHGLGAFYALGDRLEWARAVISGGLDPDLNDRVRVYGRATFFL